uniref:Uncharacterized protein n=1 Tax=Romanomermis culicivorax TaxID=13658 RepID=A0A915HIV3_ROMCU
MKLRREFNARIPRWENSNHAMYASCQARTVGLVYPLVKAVLEDKKDLEPNYTNIQVWKKEVDNTNLGIRLWELIDQRKAKEIIDVERGLRARKSDTRFSSPIRGVPK